MGDSFEDLELWLFTDADFAGDRKDMKSTSSMFLAVAGPNTFFPLGPVSKKQTVCSNSTVEAEVVAAFAAVCLVGIPALNFPQEVRN